MTAAGGPGRRTNRVVVRLDPVGDADALRHRAEELVEGVPGAQVVRVSPSGRVLLALPDGADPVAVTAELDRRPGVAYAELDVVDRGQPAASPPPRASH